MRKLITTAAAAAALSLLSSTTVLAQPGRQGPPPPPSGGQGHYSQPPVEDHGFFPRFGLNIGFGAGLGSMEADSGPIDCFNCDYSPAAGSLDFHIGGMVNPRMGVMLEVWAVAQTLDAGGFETLVQTMTMAALQYWVTPQLWLKGGLGLANLTISVDDGYYIEDHGIDKGGALMGAIGYEILSSPNFAIDLSLRLGTGSYDGIDDRVHAGTLGLGLNWF